MADEILTTEEQELFQLSNGRYIMDKDLSQKMFYIKEAKPERSHQISGTGYSWDESGMAELFSECYQNDTRFCPEAKCWYTYSKGAWRKDIGSLLVAEKIKEFCRLMALYCGEIDNEDRRREYMKFISKMGDRRFRDRLMKDAASVMPITAEEFDANPYLINCLNGTYDLQKMEFREHDWHDFLTMQTNFDYTLQDAECLRWERFIQEVTCNDADKADYLQKALGYSMLGTANEECMFILHGKTTRNGKSTLLSAIHHLLGDYASVSPVSIICKSDRSKNAEAASPVLASLKGKRFVTMAESNQYGRLDEETIKQLTGGEEIKFQTPEAMQGIFTWLLEGYFKYKRFGLKMSPAMRQVVKQYEKDNDMVLQFLEEKCEKAGGAYTRAKALYDAYKIWCKSNGYFVCSAKRFNADMEAHPEWHGGKTVYNGYPSYRDIRMKGTV